MPFTVAVLDESGYGKLGTERATFLCTAAFSNRGFDVERMGEVSVVLVRPDTIRDLNLRFRNRNEPTDVLSFEVDGPYGEMVGEIVICPECAGPHMDVEEIVMQVAIDLSGMDHGEDFEDSEMALEQETILAAARDT